MQYLRLNESQSQRIYGWFSTASNPVGSEYIVMEKLEGVTVTDVWFNLSTKERRRVIEQVMLSLQFRASGSIYFPLDLSEPERSHSVPLGIKGHEFCIGPMAHYSWWHGERGSLSYDYGPWHNSKDIFCTIGERELQWTKRAAKPRLHYERLYREVHKYEKMLPQPHVDLLDQFFPLNRPLLRHPDLQPSNIILSDSLDIVGLIDWQHATIVPLCLAAGMPAQFQNYGDQEQESVEQQHIKRQAHFFYAALTIKNNEEHYTAIFNEAELIIATNEWEHIVSSGATACKSPPIQFSAESVKRVMDLHHQQQEMDATLDQMRAALSVDVNGRISNEGFKGAKALAREIKAQMIEATDPAERRGMVKNFPFDDCDEG